MKKKSSHISTANNGYYKYLFKKMLEFRIYYCCLAINLIK